MKNRAGIEPILEALAERRQEHARHYNVHPYFTRRPANVVAAYIDRYSQLGDIVLDPFGGSGVTAIEAMLRGRRAIHNDLNPFANFLCRVIGDTSLESTIPLRRAFERLENKCAALIARIESASLVEVERMLTQLVLPENISLPRTSDADVYYDMFTSRQLAGLAVIKAAIDEESDPIVRDHLLLAWSAALAKLNKTFLSAKGRAASRGGSSIFSIYRYKLAKDIVELPIWDTFKGRFMNVITAKEEIFSLRDVRNNHKESATMIDSASHLCVIQEDAAVLVKTLGNESIDYIFTDPPYGGNIAYLDLSILWNHWLGFPLGNANKEAEAIVGGQSGFSEEHYISKLFDSVQACADLLKPDRWFSIVFQHWNVKYFQTILEAASFRGLELKAAVTQEREVIWSMHKKKSSESVLSGEMILTFYKPRRPKKRRALTASAAPMSFPEILDQVLSSNGREGKGLTNEYLLNKVVLLAWERNTLGELMVQRRNLAEDLRSRGWNYDSQRHVWIKGERQKELRLI